VALIISVRPMLKSERAWGNLKSSSKRQNCSNCSTGVDQILMCSRCWSLGMLTVLDPLDGGHYVDING
jgi:hypothetical protein